jgi:predicted metal-dependent hydrolase
LIRTNRKTIALIIQKDGTLLVRAPIRVSQKKIESFIEEKSGWIHEKQGIALKARQKLGQRNYSDGDKYLFQGRSYQLEIVSKSSSPLSLNNRFILDKRYHSRAESAFTAWYRLEARICFIQRTECLAARFGYQYNQIRISSARTRWGSCSSNGNLCFTWRLVMAPPKVIDYVIVHELAHLVEHNHSRTFWDRVKSHMPDYQKHRRWLKENGHLLTLD